MKNVRLTENLIGMEFVNESCEQGWPLSLVKWKEK